MYFLDLILAREARREKLYNEAKANKTHCVVCQITEVSGQELVVGQWVSRGAGQGVGRGCGSLVRSQSVGPPR